MLTNEKGIELKWIKYV